MDTREEFGSYILLKKLFEDPLGETFRAGKLGTQGMEQVVLLRVFNGEGVDGEKLWQKIADRGAVQEALKSPNIGSGADLGRVQGVPYVAYDYISGKTLAGLLQQAAREASPIPTDHALLITERISLGLAVGYETRIDDQRILHGFVVPQLVMLSNEGEIRVLGFEAAPGMRTAAGSGRDAFAPYLSPEALQGDPITKADDVYSLGALLLELLTGQRPRPGAGAAAVDGAKLANEGTPLSPQLAALLHKSLAPRNERISDVVTWHRTLSKLMIDGQHSATTFNLAFFMHNLFRDEIERESKEIEVEKTMVLPSREEAATTVMPVGDLAAQEASATTTADDTASVRERYGLDEPEAAGGGKKGLWIGLAAAVVLAALGGGGYYWFGVRPQQAVEPEPVVQEPMTATPATEPPPLEETQEPQPPPGPGPEEIRAQLDLLLEEKTAAMEQSLRAQYDEKIRQLQQSLEEAQKATAQQEAQPTRPAAAAPEERLADAGATGGEAAGPGRTEAGTAGGATTPGAKPAAGERTAQTGTAQPGTTPAGTPQQADGSEAGGAQAGTAQAGNGQSGTDERQTGERQTGERQISETAAGSARKTEPAPKPKVERVRVGDLVEPGPGVVPPKLRSMPDPRYPPLARRLKRTAEVEVRALVDENGRIAQSEVVGQKAGYGFDEAALAAARVARFDPATKDGVRVKMWTVMRIQFKP